MRFLNMIQQNNPEQLESKQLQFKQHYQLFNSTQKSNRSSGNEKKSIQQQKKSDKLVQNNEGNACDCKFNIKNKILSCCCTKCHLQLQLQLKHDVIQIVIHQTNNNNKQKYVKNHRIKANGQELKNQVNHTENEFDQTQQQLYSKQNLVHDKNNIQKQEQLKSIQDNANQFDWGQKGSYYDSDRKRTYSHLFINTDFVQNEYQRMQQQLLIEKRKQKLSKYQAENDTDVWSPLRASMAQKSRATQLTHSKSVSKIQNSKLDNSNISIKEVKKIQKQSKSPKKLEKNQSLIKIGRQQSIKNKEIVQNIQKMNQAIQQKIKKWRKQHKELQERRVKRSIKSTEKLKNQQQILIKQIQNQKKQLIKARLQALEERLKRKNISQLQRKKVKLNYQQSEKNISVPKSKSVALSDKQKIVSRQGQLFSLHWNRKHQQINKQKAKWERRKQFNDEIVKMRPINISKNKKIELLIQIDKSQNPLKYHLLQKRGINDVDIYNDYHDFNLPKDPKKIGIKYLQQMRQKNSVQEILKKHKSHNNLLPIVEHGRKSPVLQRIIENKSIKKLQKGSHESLELKKNLLQHKNSSSKVVKKM